MTYSRFSYCVNVILLAWEKVAAGRESYELSVFVPIYSLDRQAVMIAQMIGVNEMRGYMVGRVFDVSSSMCHRCDIHKLDLGDIVILPSLIAILFLLCSSRAYKFIDIYILFPQYIFLYLIQCTTAAGA